MSQVSLNLLSSIEIPALASVVERIGGSFVRKALSVRAI